MVNGVRAAAEGVLPRDGELRYTQSGQALLSFSIAVRDDRREQGQPAEWVKVSLWGDLAEQMSAAGVLVKGAEVVVEGRVKLNEWVTGDQKRAGLELNAWR
jgi:single stranded DNA-binding protein